jgi:Fe-S cluster assembly ATP-binding protein
LDALEFAKELKKKTQELNINPDMLKRDLNVNYSGGEKKKQEILQLSMLNPDLAILDETDSGLDIDALRIVSEGVNRSRNSENSFLVITHYQRLLNYIKPDFVHIIADGKIVKSGDYSLALELEEKGYEKMAQA